MSDISNPEYDDPVLEELLDENARLRASKAELLAAAREYKNECFNPVSDYVLRRSLREKLFEAIANAEKVT